MYFYLTPISYFWEGEYNFFFKKKNMHFDKKQSGSGNLSDFNFLWLGFCLITNLAKKSPFFLQISWTYSAICECHPSLFWNWIRGKSISRFDPQSPTTECDTITVCKKKKKKESFIIKNLGGKNFCCFEGKIEENLIDLFWCDIELNDSSSSF